MAAVIEEVEEVGELDETAAGAAAPSLVLGGVAMDAFTPVGGAVARSRNAARLAARTRAGGSTRTTLHSPDSTAAALTKFL
jgi:hypothetical protein